VYAIQAALTKELAVHGRRPWPFTHTLKV